MMTSLSDPNQNQNLKIEPLDSENQKSNLSLEPDHQGTRQECGRFQDQRTSQDRHQTSQENQAYSFEKEVEKQTREQHKSDRWHQERKYKLTSSRFGEIWPQPRKGSIRTV